MGKCVIFCAGAFHGLLEKPAPGDYTIAADGGLRRCRELGLEPDCILGDFDSLGYEPAGSLVFPAEKDDTDAMLAVRRGLSLGCREFVLYGCLEGERVDHTLAALQTLQFLHDRGARGFLVGKHEIVTVLSGTMTFPREAQGVLSLFALGGEVRGVTLENLQYPLENGVLTPGFPLGVSNHFIGKPARVRAAQGCLTVFYPRALGLLNKEEG